MCEMGLIPSCRNLCDALPEGDMLAAGSGVSENSSPFCFPPLGPRLVFTGGTALRDLSRQLIHYTHNSVHLVTPFDSGGSSAALRRSFAMPAVGDIRNRLLALADSAVVPAAVMAFCASRLPDKCEAC